MATGEFGGARGGREARCVAAVACAFLALVIAGPFAARASDGDAAETEAPAEPLRLVVSLGEQRIDVYRGLVAIDSSPVSSGQRGFETPAGVYSILQKRRWHRSNIYSRAPMPFMQRITWSGIALHAGHLPGRPASHGCIRLPGDFAEKLWAVTEIGVDVIVAPGAARPEPIEHQALLQPAPPWLDVEARIYAAGAAAGDEAPSPPSNLGDIDPDADPMRAYRERPSSPLRVLITRRIGRERMMDVQSLLAELGHDPGEIDGYLGSRTGRAIREFQKSSGAQPTGMMSEELIDALHRAAGRERVNGHLYVRQDYVDVLDTPAALADPETPLGTHVFTAMSFEDGATTTAWTVLTLTGDEATGAARALERFTIPDEVRRTLSRLMTPGTTIIVSDAGLGRETGMGTDFIVQPR